MNSVYGNFKIWTIRQNIIFCHLYIYIQATYKKYTLEYFLLPPFVESQQNLSFLHTSSYHLFFLHTYFHYLSFLHSHSLTGYIFDTLLALIISLCSTFLYNFLSLLHLPLNVSLYSILSHYVSLCSTLPINVSLYSTLSLAVSFSPLFLSLFLFF